MTRAKELREQSEQQLEMRVGDLERELFQLRNELALMHKVEKPHLIREKRREKSRILTLLTESQKGKVVEPVVKTVKAVKSVVVEPKKAKKAEKVEKAKKAEKTEAVGKEETAEKKEKVRKKREKKG
jgi:large subunit ribosomal protein L29